MKSEIFALMFLLAAASCSSNSSDDVSAVAYHPDIYIDYFDPSGQLVDMGDRNTFEIISATRFGKRLDVIVYNQDHLSKMDVYLYIGDNYDCKEEKALVEYEINWQAGFLDYVSNLKLELQVGPFCGYFTKNIQLDGKEVKSISTMDEPYRGERFVERLHDYFDYEEGVVSRYKGGMDTIAFVAGNSLRIVIPINAQNFGTDNRMSIKNKIRCP